MSKHYISPQQLLTDAYNLAWQVFDSGFRPDCVVGIWRGGTPVAIALHELLETLGVDADHRAIQTRSYTGMDQRETQVQVYGLEQLSDWLQQDCSLLLVDDVYDTGLSLQQVLVDVQALCAGPAPEMRIATPYFKPGRNQTGRQPDYLLHRTDDWLVFPHELDGLSLQEMREHKPELAALLPRLAAVLDIS